MLNPLVCTWNPLSMNGKLLVHLFSMHRKTKIYYFSGAKCIFPENTTFSQTFQDSRKCCGDNEVWSGSQNWLWTRHAVTMKYGQGHKIDYEPGMRWQWSMVRVTKLIMNQAIWTYRLDNFLVQMQCTGNSGCFPWGKRAAIVRRYPFFGFFVFL